MTNRRAQSCNNCGVLVPPGEGDLIHVDDEDESMHGFRSGWLVYHRDEKLCARLREQALDARRKHDEQEQRERQARMYLLDAFDTTVTDEASGKAYENVLEREHIELRCFGERLYGGGAWLILEPFVLVVNNGADGDDWRANFVRTGGAGARVRLPAASVDRDKVLAAARLLEAKAK